MNMECVTLEDCVITYEVNHMAAIINDGHLIGFCYEEPFPLYTTY